MDGWGGALTKTVRDKLTENNSTIALALGLSKREPKVGQKLRRRGDYILRAAGAALADDDDGAPSTPFSSVIIARESVLLAVCVQDSEDGEPLSLIPIAETFARIALHEAAGWTDPQFEFLEVAYPEETEHRLTAEAGFIMSMRIAYTLAILAP